MGVNRGCVCCQIYVRALRRCCEVMDDWYTTLIFGSCDIIIDEACAKACVCVYLIT